MVYKLLKIVIETRKISLAMCYSQKQSPELFYAFSCEFYEISKNTFFTKHLWTTASHYITEKYQNCQIFMIELLPVCNARLDYCLVKTWWHNSTMNNRKVQVLQKLFTHSIANKTKTN